MTDYKTITKEMVEGIGARTRTLYDKTIRHYAANVNEADVNSLTPEQKGVFAESLANLGITFVQNDILGIPLEGNGSMYAQDLRERVLREYLGTDTASLKKQIVAQKTIDAKVMDSVGQGLEKAMSKNMSGVAQHSLMRDGNVEAFKAYIQELATATHYEIDLSEEHTMEALLEKFLEVVNARAKEVKQYINQPVAPQE